jgi:hypothetical protein
MAAPKSFRLSENESETASIQMQTDVLPATLLELEGAGDHTALEQKGTAMPRRIVTFVRVDDKLYMLDLMSEVMFGTSTRDCMYMSQCRAAHIMFAE